MLQEVRLTPLALQLLALASLLQETVLRMLKVSYMRRDARKNGRSHADESRALVGNVPEAVARACT